MELFDAHTHIDMKHFKNDRERVIERAKDAGLVGMVSSSIGVGSFRRTLGIVEKHKDYVFQSAGCSVSQLTPDEANSIIHLTRKYANNIVAIGEVGLDYHWIKDPAGRKAQEPLFIKFIELAKELELPLVVHSRKAEGEASEIIAQHFDGDVLMHCYDGPDNVTQKIAEYGWFITLPANFGRYRNRVNAASSMPLEQILLETDGPYLSPTERRNEPANLVYGCEKLAEIQDLDAEEVASQTTKNTRIFYRL